MKQVILCLTFVCIIYSQTFNLNIADILYRNQIRIQNQKFVEQSNKINGNQFILDSNIFSDLSVQEFKYLYANLLVGFAGSFYVDNLGQLKANLQISDAEANNIIASAQGNNDNRNLVLGVGANVVVINVDWIAKGKVTPIRDQGRCGSCYAFSTLAGVQSAYLIKSSTSLQLSAQQIVDCDIYDAGCNGGWMPNVLNYVKSNGSVLNSLYPYLAKKSTCKKSTGPYKITSWAGGYINSCASLTTMLTKRPVIVAVTAGNQYFMRYKSGVLNICGSTTASIDHAVLAVSVYQDSTLNYWKIKNSWGTSWGQAGYIRLNRAVNNICKVCSYGYTATV